MNRNCETIDTPFHLADTLHNMSLNSTSHDVNQHPEGLQKDAITEGIDEEKNDPLSVKNNSLSVKNDSFAEKNDPLSVAYRSASVDEDVRQLFPSSVGLHFTGRSARNALIRRAESPVKASIPSDMIQSPRKIKAAVYFVNKWLLDCVQDLGRAVAVLGLVFWITEQPMIDDKVRFFILIL